MSNYEVMLPANIPAAAVVEHEKMVLDPIAAYAVMAARAETRFLDDSTVAYGREVGRSAAEYLAKTAEAFPESAFKHDDMWDEMVSKPLLYQTRQGDCYVWLRALLYRGEDAETPQTTPDIEIAVKTAASFTGEVKEAQRLFFYTELDPWVGWFDDEEKPATLTDINFCRAIVNQFKKAYPVPAAASDQAQS